MAETRGNAYESSQSFKAYKSQAMRAAMELNYDEKFIKELRDAKTEGEIERIMRKARHERFK